MASGRPLQKYLAKKTYNLRPWENQKMENICRNGPWTWWAVEKVEPRWWERFGCFVLCLMTIGEILVTIWLLGLYAFWLQTSHDFGDSTLSCYYCREKNPDLFEKMQRTETSDAPEPGISIFFILYLFWHCILYFSPCQGSTMTLSSGLDPSVIQPGVLSVPSASGFFYQWKYYFLLKLDFDSLAVDESVSKSFSLSKDL